MIVIVGGGICGLSIGWYLARAGQAVTILERNQIGRGATWAAAGVLSPWSPADPNKESLFELQRASHALWPDFADALESAAEIPIDFRSDGRLFLVLDHEGVEGLRAKYEINRKLGLPLEWLSGDAVRKLEPSLSPRVTDAVFASTSLVVDNRQVALALRQAFLRAGGILREQCEVLELLAEAGQIRGVRLSTETVVAEHVVVAAGAWSQQLTGLPVRPVKGQMLAVQMSPDDHRPLLTRVIGEPITMVPRSDGRLLIGATIEEEMKDTQVTAGAIYNLMNQARQIVPAIDALPVIETWAGLRPASADDAPLLGKTEVNGLSVATGHFKNGILLAPITAQAVCQLILSGDEMDVIRPFTPLRFNA